jgi:uncharacterized membrane protein YgcG
MFFKKNRKINMKIFSIILIAIIGIIFVSCTQIKLESAWVEKEITIDGKLDEWENNLSATKNSNIGVGFMNDDTNLYIAMTTYDKQLIIQVLTGLTIWIDPSNKKNKSFGIKYPLKPDMVGFIGGNMRKFDKQSGDFDYMITQRLLQQNSMHVIKDELPRYSAIDNGKNGIQTKIIYENGEFTYELKVPFSEFDLEDLTTLSIGIESAKMQQPDSGSKPQGRGGPGGGMGGGRSGGGMGGGKSSGGGMGSGRPSGAGRPEPLEYWAKVTLTKHQNIDKNTHL